MPVTLEPRGLTWINNVNMATFGSLITQVCWLVGSLVFTGLVVWLMTRLDTFEPVGPVVRMQNGAGLVDGGEVVREMVHISRETVRQLGNTLATALLVAWGVKTGAGVVDSHSKRSTNPAYKDVLEAKERGKVAGAAAAVAIKEQAADLAAARRVTREHQAQPPVEPPAGQQQTVILNPDPPGSAPQPEPPTGNALEDDER